MNKFIPKINLKEFYECLQTLELLINSYYSLHYKHVLAVSH